LAAFTKQAVYDKEFIPGIISFAHNHFMRIIFIFLLQISLIVSAQEKLQPSPLFQRIASQPDSKVYDTKAWSFYTGSPVRATPCVKGLNVYFGNAQGDFFAIDKKTGAMKWKYHTGEAIHSSAIGEGGKLFFADNKQTVYALNESNGKLVWRFDLGKKQDYPWRFDYYYSSPVLHDGKLMIGGDDGFFYALNPETGKLIWKFKCKGIIRSTGAVYKNTVFFGDTEASLYALDIKTGKERWQYKISGDTMRNENFGFDRRAINSSPVITGNKIIFGGRDGLLYCINADNGTDLWKMDHHVSWVISTVAIKDSFVVTSSSDARFVQAVNLETGREIWKHRTSLAVWASPLIVGDKVYAGSFDGQLYCIDLKAGKQVSQFKTNDKILSSPVWNDQLLYVGSDDGYLYALNGHEDKRQYKNEPEKYVYYQTGINVYFRNNSDQVIRSYLRANGFKVINSDSLINLLSKESAMPFVIVFASSYFPAAIIKNGKNSLLRKFLDGGGRVVLTGTNPAVYKIDEETKQPVGFNRNAADTIFGLDYGEGDTRSFMGDFPCFPTQSGKQLGLPDFWTTSLFIDEKNVDLVLGKNENGKVSAFAKNYSNGGQLIQIWMNADKPERLDAIIKAAEWNLE
jgi:outer membrane protein assembly factor BamB